jgi:anti-sigma factor RsiW
MVPVGGKFGHMDCGLFRENHAAFVDDALEAGERADMLRHVAACPACAAHDTTVRRALLLFRNLPSIEPSPEFSARLKARLRAERKASRFPVGAIISSAAGVVAAGYLALVVFGTTGSVRADLALAPVIALAIEPQAAPMTIYAPQSPAIVASVSAGLPVWPAAMMAAQAPIHLSAATLTADDPNATAR